jgi:hypothetical protein
MLEMIRQVKQLYPFGFLLKQCFIEVTRYPEVFSEGSGRGTEKEESTSIRRRGHNRRESSARANPSVRVPRAETRLTFYHSPLVSKYDD